MSPRAPARKPPAGTPHLKMLFSPLAEDDSRLCDRLGGAPNQWSDAAAWPTCGHCAKPLQFVVQLLGEAAGGQARLGNAAALQVFACHNNSECGFYELRSKTHHVALRRDPLVPRLGERPGGLTSATLDDPLLESRAIRYRAGTDDPVALADPDSKRGERAFSRGFIDKLYGIPVAANEPHAVNCATCSEPLSFLAQILSADEWFIYYLHVCEAGHEATFHGRRA